MSHRDDAETQRQRKLTVGCRSYWRSFEHLEAYARNPDQRHWPAWVAFNKRMGNSRGDVGIWHETYQVRAGEYETVYSGMPPYGLGAAGKLVPASGRRESARGRLARSEGADIATAHSMRARQTHR